MKYPEEALLFKTPWGEIVEFVGYSRHEGRLLVVDTFEPSSNLPGIAGSSCYGQDDLIPLTKSARAIPRGVRTGVCAKRSDDTFEEIELL